MTSKTARTLIAIAALLAVLVSLFNLERTRAGLEIARFSAGPTPITRYSQPNSTGPVVVVAHGFAGSRQIMQAYSLHLAQAGYRVLAFDFEGHGRNPRPMSGDVSRVDGTTALLVEETRRVIEAAQTMVQTEPVSLLGHSMATDILARAAIAERADATPVTAVVAVSMYSEAVTATVPQRLLMISGQWESRLREAALDAARLVELQAREGVTVASGDTIRLAMVAPWVGHVGVLFSPTAVQAAIEWLDEAYGRQSDVPVSHTGLWILLLLAGIVAGYHSVAARLPEGPQAPEMSTVRFLFAALAPAAVTPVLATAVYGSFLPVLVADYLMLHLALYGVVQMALSRSWGEVMKPIPWLSAVAIAVWGIAVFGLALDRYAASFWPNSERLLVIAVLAVGTVPFMIGDSIVTGAGRGALWRRLVARFALFASLIAAALLEPDQLTFVLIVLPVIVLFFLIYGLMGRWTAQRSGALAAGLGLGVCLAWALGVSFPLFAAA